ncbi:MAG: gamma-glutamyl-gamma-aminobutyrate hydrolase family protein [Thermaerobacter sp.]|nr:hypothetical protein [Bacillota bacterium]
MDGTGSRPLIALTAELEGEGHLQHAVPDDYAAAVWEAGGLPVVVPAPPSAAPGWVPGAPPAGAPPGDVPPGDALPGAAAGDLEAGTPAAEGDPNAGDLDGAAAAVAAWAHGLLLTGGCDVDPYLFGQHPHPRLGRVSPRRDAWEAALVRAALAAGTPILAICRGVQILNVACGGTLIQDLDAQVPGVIQHRQRAPHHHPSHEVRIRDGSLLHRTAGSRVIRVNSRHHQAVLEPGRGLVVSATAPDGVVEAVEGTGPGFVLGVQWHPENMAVAGDPVSRRLFRALVAAAGARTAGNER